MKIFKTKRMIFAVTALFIIALIPFIQSCSNNNELEGTEKIQSNVELTASEKIDIINSKEFTEYTEANIEVATMFQKLDSASKSKKNIKVGVNPNGVKYKTYPFVVDKSLFNVAKVKGDALNKKFPTLKKISRTEMKGLITETIQKSSSIRQKLINKGLISKRQNVRMKVDPLEGTTTYSTAWEAQLNASMYTLITQKECAGFRLSDGTAVVFFNPSATDTGTSYPYPSYSTGKGDLTITRYNNLEVMETFHTHLYNDYPSEVDKNAQCQYFPCATITILYNGSAYEYNYR